MKKAFLLILVILLFAFGSGIAAVYYFFIPSNRVVEAFNEGQLNLIIEGELVSSKDRPKIIDGDILLPMNVVKKYFDPNIYWDSALKKVTITTKDKVIRMKTDSLNALINNKPATLKIPVIMEHDTIYIPIEFLSDFYNIEIEYIKENNVIVIDFTSSLLRVAKPIKAKSVIRNGRSIRYPIVERLDIDTAKSGDNELRVYEEYEKWYKVRTSDGIVGYIEKRFVTVNNVIVKEVSREEKKETDWKPQNGKLNLVWEMMYNKTPELSKIEKMEGLDVVSPTWFQVANSEGTLINRSDAKYVEWAHKNGYKVWALISNDTTNPAMTGKFLNNTDSRDNAIRQILAYASLYKLDGINIDFENINKGDKDALTQFVREITPLLKEQGLIVSIDVTVPDGSDNWSLCYDRKALGQIVDYVILMAYDQHWSSSPKSGSVAQITWVEKNVIKVLEEVPKEKLVLGLPFYTRLWKEEPLEDGKVKVSSKALTIPEAKQIIKENNASVKWDDESGQFYAEYKKDGSVYKIWVEDEKSIDLKSSLVNKYKLAGAGSWRRGGEVPEIWKVLKKNLKTSFNAQ